MIEDGRIPIRGGQFIDAYNQSVSEVSGTIRRTYDSSNMHFVTEITPPEEGRNSDRLHARRGGDRNNEERNGVSGEPGGYRPLSDERSRGGLYGLNLAEGGGVAGGEGRILESLLRQPHPHRRQGADIHNED